MRPQQRSDLVKEMLDIAEAQAVVCERVGPLDVVTLPLRQAANHTLAEPVVCDRDDPPFDRSAMDGYAVRAQDVTAAPVTLNVIGEVAAGGDADQAIGAGEAVRINTGASIPPGADAVVRVEQTKSIEGGSKVLIEQGVESGKFVGRRGTHARTGTQILDPGTLMTPSAIGAAATAGASTVCVYRRPRVAILATGSELIDIDRAPIGTQIRNSNTYLLEALVVRAFGEPVTLGMVKDDRRVLREKIEEALNCDLVCVTGGISMGTFDFVPEMLEACGAVIHIRKMAIKPGRPTLFATADDGTPIFALPGNPASALVGFELLVRDALSRLQGATVPASRMIGAVLTGCLPATTNRRTYFPARTWIGEHGDWCVEPLSWQGSGDSLGMGLANALIMRGPHACSVGDGGAVKVLLLGSI